MNHDAPLSKLPEIAPGLFCNPDHVVKVHHGNTLDTKSAEVVRITQIFCADGQVYNFYRDDAITTLEQLQELGII